MTRWSVLGEGDRAGVRLGLLVLEPDDGQVVLAGGQVAVEDVAALDVQVLGGVGVRAGLERDERRRLPH